MKSNLLGARSLRLFPVEKIVTRTCYGCVCVCMCPPCKGALLHIREIDLLQIHRSNGETFAARCSKRRNAEAQVRRIVYVPTPGSRIVSGFTAEISPVTGFDREKSPVSSLSRSLGAFSFLDFRVPTRPFLLYSLLFSWKRVTDCPGTIVTVKPRTIVFFPPVVWDIFGRVARLRFRVLAEDLVRLSKLNARSCVK